MNTVLGKTAIVTGGGKGIGFQYCRQLLRNGAKSVAILGRANTNNETSAMKLNKEFGPGRGLFFPADVTDFDDFETAVKGAVKSLGGLDILINNAGILNDVAWQREIQINFTALVKSTLLGYDYMGTHKGGKGGIIVNVSSVAGLLMMGERPVYSATKHAVLAFTVALKDAYKRTGVSVRVMCPGVTDTPLITNTENRYLDIVDGAEAMKHQLKWNRQPTEHVAKSMIELIEKGANGAVWITQTCDPPFEIEMPKYEMIKF